MAHEDISRFLGLLALMLAAAKIMGRFAYRLGQPPVLGELFAGVLLGETFIGAVNPNDEVLRVFSELGLVLFLFEIGLEIDLRRFLSVITTSTTVAIAGVILPFALGYVACLLVGLPNHAALGVAAAITATSIGVTARLLADLGRLEEPESQVILGSAVLGNMFGLVILSILGAMAKGQNVTLLGVAAGSGLAYGFLLLTLMIGCYVVPWIFGLISPRELPGTAKMVALILALTMAWLADLAGASIVVGALFAGLLIAQVPQIKQIRSEIVHIDHFLVPLAFVFVGAQIDLRSLNPMIENNWTTIALGLLLTVVVVIAKFLAGYAPFWFHGRKNVIGVGIIPHGELGLVFAQFALLNKLFDPDGRKLFTAVAFMVLVTTFLAPIWLKHIFPPAYSEPPIDGKTPALEIVEN